MTLPKVSLQQQQQKQYQNAHMKLVKPYTCIPTGRAVDVRDNRGWTPIHEAASNGHSGCLEFLLRLGMLF